MHRVYLYVCVCVCRRQLLSESPSEVIIVFGSDESFTHGARTISMVLQILQGSRAPEMSGEWFSPLSPELALKLQGSASSLPQRLFEKLWNSRDSARDRGTRCLKLQWSGGPDLHAADTADFSRISGRHSSDASTTHNPRSLRFETKTTIYWKQWRQPELSPLLCKVRSAKAPRCNNLCLPVEFQQAGFVGLSCRWVATTTRTRFVRVKAYPSVNDFSRSHGNEF